MENAELDVALEELENRLERLRALYEQYFMGIERIEPAIPRKDIERRIYVLRREKIRNTAKRFKLQTIISRYNTFQQYWQRICREIENGTYKRHVIKAERIAPGKMLTIAARKRLGRRAFQDDAGEPAPEAFASAVVSSAPPPPNNGRSSAPPARITSSAPPTVPRPAPAAGPPTPKASPPAKPVPPPKPGVRTAKPPAQPEPVQASAKSFESLDLDMNFMGDWQPSAAVQKSPRAPGTPGVAERHPFGQALGRPARPAPSGPAAQRAQATAPNAALAPGAPVPKSVAALAPGAPVPKSVVTPAPSVPKPVASVPKPAASGAGVPPAARLGAAPLIARPAAPKAAAASTASLTDDRVREIHARLVEAKRETKDAGAVSLEALARSLKATEAKLREQHKNRKIDFDVVIKDGKAILKPTVR